jgi:mercuric ion transport protein
MPAMEVGPMLDAERAPRGETALGWAALAAAAGAVAAWAACCVLPIALGLAGLGIGALSWLAGGRVWLTLAALAVIAAGWALAWRRARRGKPPRLAIGLLGAASVLALAALAWAPVIEPWLLAILRAARG